MGKEVSSSWPCSSSVLNTHRVCTQLLFAFAHSPSLLTPDKSSGWSVFHGQCNYLAAQLPASLILPLVFSLELQTFWAIVTSERTYILNIVSIVLKGYLYTGATIVDVQ